MSPRRRPDPVPVKVSCPDCGSPTAFRSESCQRCGLVYSEETRRGAVLGIAHLRRSDPGRVSRAYDGVLVLTPQALYYMCVWRSSREYVGERAGTSTTPSTWTSERQVRMSEITEIDRLCLDARMVQLQGSIRIGREQVERAEGMNLREPPGWWRALVLGLTWQGLRIRARKAGGRRRVRYDFRIEDPDPVIFEEAFRRVWNLDLT
jgi:rubredoxin